MKNTRSQHFFCLHATVVDFSVKQDPLIEYFVLFQGVKTFCSNGRNYSGLQQSLKIGSLLNNLIILISNPDLRNFLLVDCRRW
jgi:hypothetical protein